MADKSITASVLIFLILILKQNYSINRNLPIKHTNPGTSLSSSPHKIPQPVVSLPSDRYFEVFLLNHRHNGHRNDPHEIQARRHCRAFDQTRPAQPCGGSVSDARGLYRLSGQSVGQLRARPRMLAVAFGDSD